MSEPTQETFSWSDVQAAISGALQSESEKHTAELDAVRAQFAGTAPASVVPAHSAGPGLETRETWSLAEQTAAREAEAAKA